MDADTIRPARTTKRKAPRRPPEAVVITIEIVRTPLTPDRLAARERFLDSFFPRVFQDEPID
jgi:hypothetical protein